MPNNINNSNIIMQNVFEMLNKFNTIWLKIIKFMYFYKWETKLIQNFKDRLIPIFVKVKGPNKPLK